MNIHVKDTVVFKWDVIKRLAHSPDLVSFRGTVMELVSGGKVAIVKTNIGTTRSIPCANLAKVKDGVVLDLL